VVPAAEGPADAAVVDDPAGGALALAEDPPVLPPLLPLLPQAAKARPPAAKPAAPDKNRRRLTDSFFMATSFLCAMRLSQER